jgi:Trk K+ transport system NAD-binding subunit
VATMERDGQVLVPTGDLRFQAGDRVAVFALPGTVRKLQRWLNR